MSWDEFVAGKWGVSHGVITAALILIGTLLFGMVGNLIACALAIGFYFVREVRQHDGYTDPHDWNPDGRRDFYVPSAVVVLNLIGVLVWNG